MNNQYLIPANSKRSMLIFGLFEPVDLIILAVGGLITLILVIVFYSDKASVGQVFKLLSPFLVSVVMVLPIPNHRNLWQFTAHVYSYFTNRRTYIWRGWCVIDGEEDGR